MLKKQFKFILCMLLQVGFCEKMMTSQDSSNNNNNNQLVVYELDLRPSDRYSGVSYDVNKKETPEERALYYAAVASVFGHRLKNNVTAEQIEEKNLLFITMPEVFSASSLSIVQEENDQDSDDNSQNSMTTQAWSNDVNKSIFVENNMNELSRSISNVRISSSLHDLSPMSNGSDIDLQTLLFKSSSENSNFSIDSKDIHELNDNDFTANSSNKGPLKQMSPYKHCKVYMKVPYNTPEVHNNNNNQIDSDDDMV